MTAFGPLDLRRVPVLPFTLAAIAGVVAALYLDVPPRLLFFVTVALFGLSVFLLAWLRGRWPVVLVVCFALASLAAFRALGALDRNSRRAAEKMSQTGDVATVVGRVTSLPDSRVPSVLLKPVVIRADTLVLSCRVLGVRVYVDSSMVASLRAGDLVSASGTLVPSIRSGRGSVGTLVAAVAGRELATLSPDTAGVTAIPSGGHHLRRAVDRARAFIRDTFDRRLSPDGAALCRALVLGDRSAFGESFSDKLRLTGLSHVFALSGVNVGVLVAVAWVILGLLFLPRVPRLLILMGLVVFYMELGRESPSLVRASLMAVFIVLGALLHRRSSPLNIVASAALVEILWRPLDVVDAGFLLSYLAVLGILAGMQVIRPRLRALRLGQAGRFWSDLAAATISAQVVTLPLVGYLFHRVALVGVIANLLAVPMFGIMLVWSLLLLVIEAVIPSLGAPVAASLGALAWATGRVVDWVAAFPLSAVVLPQFSPAALLAVYLTLGVAAIGLLARRTKMAVLALGVAANVVIWSAVLSGAGRSCTVTFFSVGNGDAALISTASGRNVLVDAGPSYGDASAAGRILRALAERKIARLDAIILTHDDNDHIGGAAEIILTMPVERVFVHPRSERTIPPELELALSARGVPLSTLSAGQILRVDSAAAFTVLSPDSLLMTSAATENEQSLVLRFDCQGSSLLLTGDADSLVEARLAAWGSLLDADLLKVSHHGSRTATTSDFLSRSSPECAVVSVGRRSRYGHPDSTVMARLAGGDVRVYRTDRDGDVTLAAANGSWQRLELPAQAVARRWRLHAAG
jgi:competence protein ComEC